MKLDRHVLKVDVSKSDNINIAVICSSFGDLKQPFNSSFRASCGTIPPGTWSGRVPFLKIMIRNTYVVDCNVKHPIQKKATVKVFAALVITP